MNKNIQNLSLQDEARRNYLLKLLHEIDHQITTLPDGRLRIKGGSAHPRYYLCRPDLPPSGRYLNRKDLPLANLLAQKDYLEKLRTAIISELNPIQTPSPKSPRPPRPEDVYISLNMYRQCLVTPLLLSDEAYIQEWQSFAYPRKGFADDFPNYHTKRGERVRSKSEILIADLLAELHIPYRYEAPLLLPDGHMLHPDFTILLSDRKVRYYEHCGKMDDPLYLQQFFLRQSSYINAGLIPGRDVFFTFEGANNPIDLKELRRIFKILFL